MALAVQIKGLDKLIKGVKKYPSASKLNLNRAIKKSIFQVEAKSKPLTPIDTGRLRGSYKEQFSHFRGVLWVQADYALYVHEGTKYMRGRPFLEDGTRRSRTFITRAFDKAVQDSLNKITR